MVRNNICGIIGEYDTNNMATNLVSKKTEVIISYWQSMVAITIQNNSNDVNICWKL